MLWSESRDLGECEGAVETWDAAGGAREREVWSRVETWMQRSKQVRKSARDLDARSKASAKICSRPVRRDLDGSSVKSASALHAAHAKKT